MIPIQSAKNLIEETLTPLIENFGKIALFDFPNYANVGDSAIWLGTMDFLKENAPYSSIVWMSDIKSLNPENLPTFDKDTVLIINGGGNFGDLWNEHQTHRELIVSRYLENRVIQLPQSIHFENEENLERTKATLEKHNDFHLVVRDSESFDIAKNISKDSLYLCPDMAFYIRKIPKLKKPEHSIVALMRTDKEGAIFTDDGDSEIPVFDWLSEPKSAAMHFDKFMKHYPSINRIFRPFLYRRLAEERFKRGCNLLMQGNVVITDRLHAHIMCSLLGITSIVMDNSYGKIHNFLDAWDSKSDSALRADSFCNAVALAKACS